MENRKLVMKFKKLADKATFTNKFIESIKKADLSKDLYENGITTGTDIDGQCIRLKTLEKWCGSIVVNEFLNSFKNHKRFVSMRFPLYGYDGTLWCEEDNNGNMYAGLSKEYRNCGNGYYYMLINDETFIGCDID